MIIFYNPSEMTRAKLKFWFEQYQYALFTEGEESLWQVMTFVKMLISYIYEFKPPDINDKIKLTIALKTYQKRSSMILDGLPLQLL